MRIQNILVTSRLYKEIEAILLTKQLNNDFLFIPEEQVTQKELQWADAYVGFGPTNHFTFENIKWVHSLGAGVDRFLLNRDWKEDVLLTRTMCSFGERIREYCLSYILRDLQKHEAFMDKQQNRLWQPETPPLISGKKVMIYGTGDIGQSVASLFSQLGFEVEGVSMSGTSKEGFAKVFPVYQEKHRLAEMDYIINTLPLTRETTHLFNSPFFEKLSGAVFINVGRGASVDEAALLSALRQNHVRSAILDVFSEEPLPESNPLWTEPNVVITPHISAVTTAEEAVNCFLETLEKVEANEVLKNRVAVQKGY